MTNGLFIVNDGVDTKDFEKFVKDEWAQTANTAKGITCHVAKAHRGDRETGHYMARKAYLRKDAPLNAKCAISSQFPTDGETGLVIYNCR